MSNVTLILDISTEQKSQFYSEIYVFVTQQMKSLLSDYIQFHADDIHEDLFLMNRINDEEANRMQQILLRNSKAEIF